MSEIADMAPTPWGWEDQGFVGRPMGHGFVYLLDANGRKIGTAWGKPAEKVVFANMATAAPDLYAALKAVVAVADRKTVEFDMARAALAKAEGRQP